MNFTLSIPSENSNVSRIDLAEGEILFILGANGTGKSSLMQKFAQQNHRQMRKLAAHRHNLLSTNQVDLTPAAKVQVETNIIGEDSQPQGRYKDQFATQRASLIVFELLDSENVLAREIADKVRSQLVEEAKLLASKDAPVATINELLKQSNIPIELKIRANESLMASKNGSPEYSVSELSDGERNAMLIAATVLGAKPGTLLIIDEPERHLHRSIIAPMIQQLVEHRPDCAFIVSTHDHELPIGLENSRTLLIRSCEYHGNNAQKWVADELPQNSSIDDILKRDLLGSRRKILFVEGSESSLDKPLYSLIFPGVSIVPKGSCHEVERTVSGLRKNENLHWLHAFGIADGDGFDDQTRALKQELGVYLLPYYSVEAIYYHPRIIKMVAEQQIRTLGGCAEDMTQRAISQGLAAVAGNEERLCQNTLLKARKKFIQDQLPSDKKLLETSQLKIEITLPENTALVDEIRIAVANAEWEIVLNKCPIRESGALDNITRSLEFNSKLNYEKAVRNLLSRDPNALRFTRSLFAGLSVELVD